jgi:hypothetical protein
VDIRDLLDDHLLVCVDRQLAFSEVVGSSAYSVDLEAGTVSFRDGPTLRVGLLGSAAPGPGSWLWAWANPTPYPEPVMEAVTAVRAFGEARGVRELVTPEIPLDDDWDATRAGVASVAASGIELYLPLDAGGGTQAILAVHDAPPLPAPHPEPTRLGPVITQVTGLGIVTDWPRALRAYASYRGGALEEQGLSDDGHREFLLTPAGGDSGATVEVDDLGRLRSISMTRKAGDPQPLGDAVGAAPRKKGVLGRLFGR